MIYLEEQKQCVYVKEDASSLTYTHSFLPDQVRIQVKQTDRPLTLTLILDTLLACLYKQVSKCVKYKGKCRGRVFMRVLMLVRVKKDVSNGSVNVGKVVKKGRPFLTTLPTLTLPLLTSFFTLTNMSTLINTLPLHLPLYLTHLLTYLYKQASSVSSIRVSVRGLSVCFTCILT